ncbi:Predicted protein [[Clostridium] ultunense Esp]|uniref:hypothetical protein n=1 Tax=Thermicanus aegyptius TaxID=94009 RepID=UPI0002B6EEB2|nr:hypothetical protein [Thermicanus aegyptius]CCQ94448.1 Predicted protein [[Clostridium] ultunense Esp]
MEMTAQEVLERIRLMKEKGASLNKKRIKRDDPELMRNALYYYPSWEHVLRELGVETT